MMYFYLFSDGSEKECMFVSVCMCIENENAEACGEMIKIDDSVYGVWERSVLVL